MNKKQITLFMIILILDPCFTGKNTQMISEPVVEEAQEQMSFFQQTRFVTAGVCKMIGGVTIVTIGAVLVIPCGIIEMRRRPHFSKRIIYFGADVCEDGKKNAMLEKNIHFNKGRRLGTERFTEAAKAAIAEFFSLISGEIYNEIGLTSVVLASDASKEKVLAVLEGKLKEFPKKFEDHAANMEKIFLAHGVTSAELASDIFIEHIEEMVY